MRPLNDSLSAFSWSFSQLQILAQSHLGPPLQLLLQWVTEISVVLKQESKKEIFITNRSLVTRFSISVF